MAGKLSLRRPSRPGQLISLVPMIDVMVILLVFFMVTICGGALLLSSAGAIWYLNERRGTSKTIANDPVPSVESEMTPCGTTQAP